MLSEGTDKILDFGLALLEKGQKDAVLEYFELCEKFWKYPPDMKKLERWKAAVEAGITPDFGTNLSL